MSRLLLETIKCLNGKLCNLEYHQTRFDLTRKINFSLFEKVDLNTMVKIPEEFKFGLSRCRIIYSEKIEKIEFLPHQIKKINTLKLVEDDTIDYQFKYYDRTKLNTLFEKREYCDDILIVKNSCITDSSAANPIFFDNGKWWTPDSPLLPGTQRAKLISERQIFVCKITPDDLSKFTKVGLINALQDMNEMPIIDIRNIF